MVIKRGRKSSAAFPELLCGHSLISKEVMFTSTCIYDINTVDLVHPLFGIKTIRGSRSISFGWMYDQLLDAICIYAESRVDGKPSRSILGSVSANEWYTFDIVMADRYTILAITKDVTVVASKFIPFDSIFLGWFTRPRLSFLAPHNITIKIK